MSRPLLAITAGEPAGIGPDLCAALMPEQFDADLVVLGDAALLRERGASAWPDYQAGVRQALSICAVPLRVPSVPGRLEVENAPQVLALLDRAAEGALSGEFDAIVTAPVHKGIINQAGHAFSGHTEYFADAAGVPRVVMLLVGGGMRVALASTHLPLADVPAAITPTALRDVLRILDADLRSKFQLAEPRILVAGLNPHAGEGGHLGREELDVIVPVLDQLRGQGLRLEGPLPADTLFTPRVLARGDAVLAMYHDQGLPVLKYASFGQGVNVTLGLPFVRTSVDHGTALDLAGSGAVDHGSFHAAIRLALELAQRP